ncbi:MAG: hypothetical protein ACK45B_08185, partial [Limisphaerales bacterium]
LPRAGRDYTHFRNLDLPGHLHVSRLSPWLRHRLVTEAEVIAAARGRHPERPGALRAWPGAPCRGEICRGVG